MRDDSGFQPGFPETGHEPGNHTDFLVVSGDPLAEVLNVRKVVVYKRGQRLAQPAAGLLEREANW